MRDHNNQSSFVGCHRQSSSEDGYVSGSNASPSTTTDSSSPSFRMEQPLKIPDKLVCCECNGKRTSSQVWWCRTCLKTVCTQCNLFNRHTEHRSSPWSVEEMAQSLVNLGLVRQAARKQRAAEEELAIKDYMRQVELYFVRKLEQMTKEKDDGDKRLIDETCRSVNFDPGKALSTKDTLSPSAPILSICQTFDEAKFQNLIGQLRTLSGVAKELNDNCSKNNAPTWHRNEFKQVLPSLKPDQFALNLEIELAPDNDNSINNLTKNDQQRSKSLSTDDDNRNVRRFAALNFHCPQEDEREAGFDRLLRQKQEKILPIEPRISIVNETKLGLDESGSDVDVTDGAAFRRDAKCRTRSATNFLTHNGHANEKQLLVGNSQPSVGTLIGRYNSSGNQPRPLSSMSHHHAGVRPKLSCKASSEDQINLAASSTLSLAGSSVWGDDLVNVTAFSFGKNYLSRPIDVCALPGNQLAVSDSCGGVYITDKTGHVMHKISLDGGSASSLCYCASSEKLFVGMLSRSGRCINVYDTQAYDLYTNLPCPLEPKVEMSRSRWICLTPTGDLYGLSGDNNLSALWRFSFADTDWITVLVTRSTRYQYLNFVEQNDSDHSGHPSTTLLTCECLSGNMIFLTVKCDELIAQMTLQNVFPARDYICSPASAVRDQFSNLLILDYLNGGKVYLFEAPQASKKERRLRTLMEVGNQEGMGICARDGWCFVVCVNKRCVRAIQYAEV